jgi:hypothetical protein
MNYKIKLLGTASLLIYFASICYGQDSYTPNQTAVLDAMQGLSETTAPGGKGAKAYGTFLDDDFTRWTLGSTVVSDKQKWLDGIKDWFNDGWRITDRDQQIIEITILNDVAHTRRIVSESYLGLEAETSTSKAALVEIWVFRNDKWLLYRVNVQPIYDN